jgi:hypothetical protein
LGVSRHGEFKNTTKIFGQKVHVENFFQNFDKNFDVSFSSTFFCFIAFSGVFQRWEFKNTTKKRFTKKLVSKSFPKKFDQKSQTDFFSILFYYVFGRFSVRGVQKHDKKIPKNKSDPSPVLASDPPTYTGVTGFFLAAP